MCLRCLKVNREEFKLKAKGLDFLKKSIIMYIYFIKQQDYILLSYYLKNLKELVLKPTYISVQVFNRYLNILEKVYSIKNKIYLYTKYTSFRRCSVIAFIVKVFPILGLLLKLHVSTYQKTKIRALYYKRTMTLRPFLLTKLLNS